MENHRSTKKAFRLALSVVGFAVLLGAPAALAQVCSGTLRAGCKIEGAKCSANGRQGRCETAKDPERECDCVAPPVVQPPPPDAAITLLSSGTTTCPSSAELTPSLTQALIQLGITNSDIRRQCLAENGGSRLAILIWTTTVASGSTADQLRNQAQLPSGISDASFAVFLTEDLINTIAQPIFKKSYSGVAGYPDIHLTRLSLGYPGGDVVQTVVNGNDTQFTPTIDFTNTITDQLVSRECSPATNSSCKCLPGTNSNCQCSPATDSGCGCISTTKSNISDSQIFEVVAASFGAWFTLAESNLLAYYDQPPSNKTGGVGCTVYQLLPGAISLPETGAATESNSAIRAADLQGGTNVGSPQKTKLVIPYNRVSEVNQGVAFFAIPPPPVPRTPAVQIMGPASVIIQSEESSVTVNYAVVPTDFYAPLWYTWSGGPTVQIAQPAQLNTAITFSGKNLGAEQSNTQTITVAVNDSEGAYVTATQQVTVTRARPAHPR